MTTTFAIVIIVVHLFFTGVVTVQQASEITPEPSKVEINF